MKRNRVALLAFVSAGILAGCELIVNFDRTKIDGGIVEAGMNDVTGQPDTSMDAPAMDAPADTAMDAPAMDASADTAMDAPAMDAPDDTAMDAMDAGLDADLDAPDGE
jgi:hypothetical protein